VAMVSKNMNKVISVMYKESQVNMSYGQIT